MNNFRSTPSIICAQNNAAKVSVTEEDLIQSNINGFGDDIGKITNRVTSMFDVMAGFPPDSEEYKVLDYRIKSGQLLQQDAIDKVKGIIVRPMPKSWYDRSANRITDEMTEEEIERCEFNLRILADKKPYFMRYIYPDVMTEYNDYIKNTNRKAVREFRETISDLLSEDECNLTDEEKTFLHYYHIRMPVGTNDCVMNRICRRFEEEFDHYFAHNKPDEDFDYTIMKSGEVYTNNQYYEILKLYKHYVKVVQNFMKLSKQSRLDDDDIYCQRSLLLQNFMRECCGVCSNEKQLCDIILDVCYKKNGTKYFCWGICDNTIINNLLDKNGNVLSYPVEDPEGDIEFCGKKFSMATKEVVR